MTQFLQNIKKIINESKSSVFLSLNSYDFVKGFMIAFFSAFGTAIFDVLSSGSFIVNWHSVLSMSIGATGSYLIKNLFTNKDGEIFKKAE